MFNFLASILEVEEGAGSTPDKLFNIFMQINAFRLTIKAIYGIIAK